MKTPNFFNMFPFFFLGDSSSKSSEKGEFNFPPMVRVSRDPVLSTNFPLFASDSMAAAASAAFLH
ncbi:hypothetical protein HanRHA438_Chr14g0669441 [Helianthus annuus]|nr:hypothetical protein HanIR_Chr14g0714481 [Helianthus annuus]KAJ0855075.1 hypothetical protein HanRHA438_Chr14g0669441 [Helianthus annuus]